jgi:hypothetical protein
VGIDPTIFHFHDGCHKQLIDYVFFLPLLIQKAKCSVGDSTDGNGYWPQWITLNEQQGSQYFTTKSFVQISFDVSPSFFYATSSEKFDLCKIFSFVHTRMRHMKLVAMVTSDATFYSLHIECCLVRVSKNAWIQFSTQLLCTKQMQVHCKSSSQRWPSVSSYIRVKTGICTERLIFFLYNQNR